MAQQQPPLPQFNPQTVVNALQAIDQAVGNMAQSVAGALTSAATEFQHAANYQPLNPAALQMLQQLTQTVQQLNTTMNNHITQQSAS